MVLLRPNRARERQTGLVPSLYVRLCGDAPELSEDGIDVGEDVPDLGHGRASIDLHLQKKKL